MIVEYPLPRADKWREDRSITPIPPGVYYPVVPTTPVVPYSPHNPNCPYIPDAIPSQVERMIEELRKLREELERVRREGQPFPFREFPIPITGVDN